MNKSDLPAFLDEMADLAAMFDRYMPEDRERRRARGFFQDLEGYVWPEVQRAMRRVRSEPGRTRFPAVGELIASILAEQRARAEEAERARPPQAPWPEPTEAERQEVRALIRQVTGKLETGEARPRTAPPPPVGELTPAERDRHRRRQADALSRFRVVQGGPPASEAPEW